jgi:hypothetical protein
MLAIKTVALAAGFSLVMFGLAGTAAAKDHHHHHDGGDHHKGHHHQHGDFNEGYGFAFEIPDVYVDLSNGGHDAHVSWCYRHKPNYDEDSDMYFSHGYWKPCIAPFD